MAHYVLVASFANGPNLLSSEANTPVVETVGTPEAWADLMKRYGDTLAAGEATPVHEEVV